MSNRGVGKKITQENDHSSKEMFPPLLIECKSPSTAVLLLSSSEEIILIKACDGIRAFAEKCDENKVSLVDLGALDPLCGLISHSHALVRRKAVITLGTMATSSDVKNALKKVDVIPSIVDILSVEDVVVREFATLCLASLSEDHDCKEKIFDSKGLPPLIQLLSSPDSDVQKNSLEVIFNMFEDPKCCQAVHKLGAIRPLLELLQSDFPVIQSLALKTLQSVTVDEDTLVAFRDEQGLEKLMNILSNADFGDLHVEALRVLSNCLCDSESVQEIHKNGGLERLVEFLLTSTEPEIHLSAIKCITRVAENSDSQKLKKHNVEKVLVNLLSTEDDDDDDDIKTAICEAVQVMSNNQASTDCFRELGAIPEVIKLLKPENVGLREAATCALCGVINGSKLNALAVFEAGGHAALIKQLRGGSPAMVANSIAALCNLAGEEVIRRSILSHGAIQALVASLNSTSTQVLVYTLQCLTVLVCDTESGVELRSAGGLQPLVNLLRSNDDKVLQNVCSAINTFASDERTSAEIYQLGALEMLQEINQLQSRRSKLSKMAMISLLNFNLPVKYGLMGRLASTDKISDGFYDVGKSKAVDKILTLEELSKQPVNNLQPIIVVNTGAGKEATGSEGRRNASPEMSTSSKMKKKTKVEDDSPKETISPKRTEDSPWKMMDDVILQSLVKEVKESIPSLNDERDKCAALARLVSEVMGGEIQKEKLHEFPWGLHLSVLKFELQSNVIPIGLIRHGFYYHRALLFKCLADCIGLNCTLNRGDYNRAWNEVFLFPEDSSNSVSSSEPSPYVVDLMHQPGHLLALNTPAAVQYQTI